MVITGLLKLLGSSKDKDEIERLYRTAIAEIPKMFNQLTLSLFEQEKQKKGHFVEDLINDDIRARTYFRPHF